MINRNRNTDTIANIIAANRPTRDQFTTDEDYAAAIFGWDNLQRELFAAIHSGRRASDRQAAWVATIGA